MWASPFWYNWQMGRSSSIHVDGEPTSERTQSDDSRHFHHQEPGFDIISGCSSTHQWRVFNHSWEMLGVYPLWTFESQ